MDFFVVFFWFFQTITWLCWVLGAQQQEDSTKRWKKEDYPKNNTFLDLLLASEYSMTGGSLFIRKKVLRAKLINSWMCVSLPCFSPQFYVFLCFVLWSCFSLNSVMTTNLFLWSWTNFCVWKQLQSWWIPHSKKHFQQVGDSWLRYFEKQFGLSGESVTPTAEEDEAKKHLMDAQRAFYFRPMPSGECFNIGWGFCLEHISHKLCSIVGVVVKVWGVLHTNGWTKNTRGPSEVAPTPWDWWCVTTCPKFNCRREEEMWFGTCKEKWRGGGPFVATWGRETSEAATGVKVSFFPLTFQKEKEQLFLFFVCCCSQFLLQLVCFVAPARFLKTPTQEKE